MFGFTRGLRPAPDTVRAALADAAGLGPFFTLTLGGPDEGWHPVRLSYARGMSDLVTRTAAGYGTGEVRVAASIVQLGHAARLWSPLLACAAMHGVVPDLTALQRADEGTALRLPAPAGRLAGDLDQATGLLYRIVVNEHLEPLAAGLRVKIAPRLLYGNAASALAGAAHAALTARPGLRVPLTRLTTALLGTGRLAGLGEITGPGLTFRRRTCCLYYRVPGGAKCGDCALTAR
ncbi:(2Fe-2S)-binding protein [Bailinhaonella thermotolerans]|uniref:(2Fe-2S)-binding protein n=1 Tax=Bailinhaonella thermotolerans TaxID=1070861 RepID=A0A3A4B252_9ACTN|nr:(2Fe-2S)-binding protein [Bailinhaonella thermotolerans]RJL35815.1 (2Fe-2S)-binding protein [Bailinhaonella thermotolerans]